MVAGASLEKLVLSTQRKNPRVDPLYKMRRMQRAEAIVAETLNHKRGVAWRGLEPSPNTGTEVFEKPHPRGGRSCLPAFWKQPGLNGFEQPEVQGVVFAFERDHKAHASMLRRVGIAR